MTTPTQSDIIRDLTDEIMKLIETDTAERDLIEAAVNVHFTRFMQATFERLDRAAREQREKLKLPPEPACDGVTDDTEALQALFDKTAGPCDEE